MGNFTAWNFSFLKSRFVFLYSWVKTIQGWWKNVHFHLPQLSGILVCQVECYLFVIRFTSSSQSLDVMTYFSASVKYICCRHGLPKDSYRSVAVLGLLTLVFAFIFYKKMSRLKTLLLIRPSNVYLKFEIYHDDFLSLKLHNRSLRT